MPGNRKVTAGQAFHPSAGEWNRHVDTADYLDRFRLGEGGDRARGFDDTNIVWTKNDSGANRRKGDILEFTGLAFTNLDDDDRGWMVGGNPTLANGFGVLLKAVPNADFAYLQVAGQCFAYVYVGDTDHKWARVDASTYVLQSAAVGPVRILYKPGSTGEQKCKVFLGLSQCQIFYGKPTGAKNVGATDATIELWKPDFSASLNTSINNVIVNVRNFTTNTKVIGNIVDGVANAFPKDCSDS